MSVVGDFLILHSIIIRSPVLILAYTEVYEILALFILSFQHESFNEILQPIKCMDRNLADTLIFLYASLI